MTIPEEDAEILDIHALRIDVVAVVDWDYICEEVLFSFDLVNNGLRLLLRLACEYDKLEKGFQGSEHVEQEGSKLYVVFLVGNDVVVLCSLTLDLDDVLELVISTCPLQN